jgi:dTDP-4-amino-4,6-dideoxygalactose transaminase
MNIPVFKPSLTDHEINAAVESLRLGWLGPGSYVHEFEKKIAEHIGVDQSLVVAVNTGTSAVHLGLVLSGVGEGDEVITPSFNNIADFHAIKMQGANPVFCDIIEDTLTINPANVESLITERTKAIICIDFGTSLCDYDAVKIIAGKYNIPVIHDAAHAFGSKYKGQMVGSYSDICAFSFDPVKNITCIDGGAIIVKSLEFAQRLRAMRQLGQQQNQEVLYKNQRSWTYDVSEIGFRYHLANLHGAIGVEQMKRIEFIQKQRQRVCDFYTNALNNLDGLILPHVDNEIFPFIYVVRVQNGKRKDFINYMKEHGVDTGIHWQTGHKFSFLKNEKSGSLIITDKIAEEIVTLPTYPDLTDEELAKIINTIYSFFM